MSQTQGTVELLREHWGRFVYEYEMFHDTATQLVATAELKQFVRNACLESFALHTRNLVVFFFNSKDHGEQAKQKCKLGKQLHEPSNDLLADKYVRDQQLWFCQRWQHAGHVLGEAHKRANALVAHLSTKRARILSKERDWRVKEINSLVDRVCCLFLEHVDPQKVPEEGIARLQCLVERASRHGETPSFFNDRNVVGPFTSTSGSEPSGVLEYR